MRFGDPRVLLDRAYAARDEEGLVSGLARAASAELGGVPVIVVTYEGDPARGVVRLRAIASKRVPGRIATEFARTFEQLPPDFVRGSLRMQAITAKSNPRHRSDLVEAYIDAVGAGDLLTVNGWDASGKGVLLSAHLPRPTKLTATEATVLTRVGAHHVSALRLLERPEEPLARFVRGRLDVTPGAELPADALARLARAVVVLRRAAEEEVPRGVGRASPRVDGEWSVVGRFVDDGAEHLVVRKNPAPSPGREALTARERQIVALLEAGHHMKLVAYELGISYATVRVLAARARRKLGRTP